MLAAWLAAAVLLAPAGFGIDHVPIAVNDLEQAAAAYRRLGFALKPGRPHANGIRNLHAKFPDGTELELITAPAARDALTTTYRRHLAAGDGPAFLAFYVPPGRQRPPGDVPAYVFFGPRNHSPTDRPEHFAHANGAESLRAVWLAGDDLAAERKLLSALGASFEGRTLRLPDEVRATVAVLADGEVRLLPGSRSRMAGRPIVGATVRVRRLAEARRVLAGAGVAALEKPGSLFIAPADANGLWLELTGLR